MKRLISIAVVAVLVVIVGVFVLRAKPEKPMASPGVTGHPKQVELGEYLARAGDCVACHTKRGGQPFAGGLEVPTPFGTMYTPNITPDNETGIGKWTDDDFWRAMHEGKSKDGSFLYPAFPYNNYTKVTRADSDAIFAYLMSLQPIRNQVPLNQMNPPFNRRELLAGWRTLFFTSGVYQENPKQSKEWNRGAYLVEGLGHCNACHGARNILGAVRDDDVGGGLIPVQNWYAPSLTSSRESGLGDWSIEEIVDLLKTGVSARGAVTGPMAEVVLNSLQYMTDEDNRAMAIYLKAQRQDSAPPSPGQVRPTYEQTEAMYKRGGEIYEKMCAECHMPKGEGVPRVYPPLDNNKSVTIDYPVNAIRLVLSGGFPPSTQGNPRPYGMPPFGQDLNDDDIAAVVTYIRQSWGNKAPAVSPAEVARFRGVPID